jgi:hypothetical protein
MTRFADARAAKEFLISRIVAEAKRENVPLSEIERKMLYFSETGWTLPDIVEVNDKFDSEYDQDEYEKKISRLAHNETKRIRKDNPDDFADWISAVRKLKTEDHYISVMVDAGVDRAGVSTGKISDNWKTILLLVVWACFLVACEPILTRCGVFRSSPEAGQLTLNNKLDSFLGYAWLSISALFIAGLAWSHFDSDRRLYKALDRIEAGLFRLFGIRKK